LQEITSDAVSGQIGLDEGTKTGTDMGSYHVKELVVHRHVVYSEEDVGVHLLDFKHVIDVGSCVVLAGIALATLHQWSLLRLVFLLVQVQSPLRELIKLTGEA